MISETLFIVRYAETDQMGVVHHSNYAVWFEAGRTDYLRKTGMSNSEIEARGMMLPLSKLNCTFKSPAKYEDEVIVKTRIKKMSCARVEFEYEVINSEDGKILAVGETIHAWTDKKFKPINIEKRAPEVYRKIAQTLE